MTPFATRSPGQRTTRPCPRASTLTLALCALLGLGPTSCERTPSGNTRVPTGETGTQREPDENETKRRDANTNAEASKLTPEQRAHADYIRDHFDKREVRIPMRDGVELFTQIFAPKDRSRAYPILLKRTPYGLDPYGAEAYPNKLGPSPLFPERGYIFVYQDVRGRFMSGGTFVNVRPHIDRKDDLRDIDESSDAHDTISWLLANVDGHNGRVGMWGISYPGFYAAAGMIDAHPALKAVSPQAPIADWYFDDFHHHGAFFLPHCFNFFARFGQPREGPTTEWPPRFQHGTDDGYQWFLDVGALKNLDARYLHGRVAFWNELVQHPDRDEFWQARDLLPHLQKTAPAVMTVGGLFDAEDLYGPLHIYRAIEHQNPGVFNILVMGPWRHGGWGRTLGDHLGNITFGAETSRHYQKNVELVFFEHFLREGASKRGPRLPEALVFNTGANAWREFKTWPPRQLQEQTLYLGGGGTLGTRSTANDESADHFVSDPADPVPFTETTNIGMTGEYMTDDQRFAAARPDVLTYQTAPLTADLTIAGPVHAELWVATDQGDADWVVKLIDVFPDDAQHADEERVRAWAEDEGFVARPLAGYQMMVRSEVLRGRYRDSYTRPAPFLPDRPTLVTIPLQDVLHTFKAGHRVMVQIQSTWFPLVDRNPQKYVDNIFAADDGDFVKATHSVFRSRRRASRIRFGALASDS